jgi:hypothetical protein
MSDEELKELLSSIRSENASGREETRQHFNVVAERIESRLDLVAEGLRTLDEKFSRRFESVESKLEQTAGETQVMIKFSHAELDRRVRSLEQGQRTLEETIAELQARVDRLESSAPH